MTLRITTPVARVLRVFLDGPAAPRYGFELMHRTQLASGTLYPILVRLERAGWVSRETEGVDPAVAGRPARKLYVLTAEGARAARRELDALANELRPPTSPSILRPYGGHA